MRLLKTGFVLVREKCICIKGCVTDGLVGKYSDYYSQNTIFYRTTPPPETLNAFPGDLDSKDKCLRLVNMSRHLMG